MTDPLTGYLANYSYDANGNRATRTINSVTETYAYDGADKLMGITGGADPRTFTYDAAGRTTAITRPSSDVTSFAYDYESRVTSISRPGMTTNTFDYNGLNTRVEKVDSAGTAAFLRDGVGVTDAVLDDGSAVYTPGGEVRSSAKTTFHAGIKNSDLQTDGSQAVSASRLYDAFGNVLSSAGTWTSPFGNAGQFGYQEDLDSEFKLLGHRYLDSSTGRFLTRDPIKDGRNWYGYCENNPLASVDPIGLMTAAALLPIALGTALADGPLPIGDAIAVVILLAAGVLAIAEAVSPKAPPYTGNPGDTSVGPWTSRHYGPDGLPEVDRDYNNPGTGHPTDESHDWRRTPDGTPVRDKISRPPKESDPVQPWNNPDSPHYPGPASSTSAVYTPSGTRYP